MTTFPRCPAGLQARGRALWRAVHESFELDPVESTVLAELCRCVDRIDGIEAELTGQPLTVSGSAGQPRVHPLLGALREHQKLADRLAVSLGVSMPDAAGSGRPSGHQRKAAKRRWNGPKTGSVTAIRGV
ncbi:hypothetical protein LAUMK4_02518 [Mycobacterium persicum]|uniref:Terminase n=2 Tax=Mycobacterium persicum TaxID=1487726 RepID=A0ABY6RI96_9MYCO|nr:hypothetical protein LAUMK15_02844 [Mycobacterium persicum]VAZ93620.1 hypothetical protein LAUMK4_02518 [Mycobacterium persicum]